MGVMFDWNDLKAFLAVARGGSTLAASKALGVNQTTVARRIESLEQDLGFKLFERGQTGSRLTEAGEVMIPDAEGVERAALTIDAGLGVELLEALRAERRAAEAAAAAASGGASA